MGDTYHIPVLRNEVLDFLQVNKQGIYVDCTLGGGGHTEAILEQGGTVLGIDRDTAAIDYAGQRLARFGGRFQALNARFSDIQAVTGDHAGAIDGVLMDLGVSSRMIDDPNRGFSFQLDGPLSMEMGLSGESAAQVLNSWDAPRLGRMFREYGEERRSRAIAEAIVAARQDHPLTTTGQLAEIVEQVVGGKFPQKSKARIFQALRIEINDELGELRHGLAGAEAVLRDGGRLCVIAYHSLEDRLVKTFMRDAADPCICPSDLPECRCGKRPTFKQVTRKAVRATAEESAANPRARSALLRVAERIRVGGDNASS